MRYSVRSELSRWRETRKSRRRRNQTALFLVRAQGDPAGYEHYFREKDGDKRVKVALESCLGHGLKLGPFKVYTGIV
jgi:hypothetical protein